MKFFQTFFGTIAGKLFLLVAATLGFGADVWIAHVFGWWRTTPLPDASVMLLRTVGSLLGLICLFCFAWPMIRGFIRPKKLSVSFDPARDVHARIEQFNAITGQPLPNRCTFVHVRVESIGDAFLNDCRGAVTLLERLDDAGNVVASQAGTRPVLWAPREHNMVSQKIAPHAPQDLDIFRTVEGVDRLELLTSGHPQSWVNFFDAPGKYRIKVVVTGDDRSESIRLQIDWKGRWDPLEIIVG